MSLLTKIGVFLLLIIFKLVVVRELKAVCVLMGRCCHRSESASAGQRSHPGGSGQAGPAAGGPAELSAAEVCVCYFRTHFATNLLVPADRRECSMFWGFSLTQDQLTSTGGVWQVCDQFAQLPRGQFVSPVFTLLGRKVLKNKIGRIKADKICR